MVDLGQNFTFLGSRAVENQFLPLGMSDKEVFALKFIFDIAEDKTFKRVYLRENYRNNVLSSNWLRIFPKHNEVHILRIPFLLAGAGGNDAPENRIIEIGSVFNTQGFAVELYESNAPASAAIVIDGGTYGSGD